MLPLARRILFVEDNIDTRDFVVSILTDYEVVTAGTVAEALTLAQRGRFDLYLLDNWLPDGTGVDLTRQLRALTLRAPILFYSAVVSDVAQAEARAAGAQGYVNKPCPLEELEQAIAQLLPDVPAAPGTSANLSPT